MLHESDIAVAGSEGWVLMQIEHFVPQSEDETLVNVFANCFFACRRCNRARSTKEITTAGRGKLLNPCSEVWRERFVISFDRVLPRAADQDAGYTEQAYQLNDPKKVVLREVRRKTIWQCRDALERLERSYDALLDRAMKQRSREDLELARDLAKIRPSILRDLYRYAAIPDDKDPSCHCGEPGACALPKVLEEQTWKLD